MASKKARSKDPSSIQVDLLQKLLIVQLGLEGVSRDSIRHLVGLDNNKVSEILGLIRKKGKKNAKD